MFLWTGLKIILKMLLIQCMHWLYLCFINWYFESCKKRSNKWFEWITGWSFVISKYLSISVKVFLWYICSIALKKVIHVFIVQYDSAFHSNSSKLQRNNLYSNCTIYQFTENSLNHILGAYILFKTHNTPVRVSLLSIF